MSKRKSHPGSIETRGNSRRLILRIDGERHVDKIPSSLTDEQAEDFARQKFEEYREAAARRELGLPDPLRVSELLRKYEAEYLPTLSPNSQASYPKSLTPIRVYFVEKLGDPELSEVRRRHVLDFMAWRRVHGPHGKPRKKPLSNRTIEKDRAILHRVFRIAEDLELRDGNPVARTRPPKVKERDPVLLTDVQLESLLEACGENAMLRLWIVVLAESGVRSQSEALWLRWEDLDLQEGFLWIDSSRHGRRTKSGKGRWVPMTERLRGALRDHAAEYRLRTYHDGKRSPWVFHWPWGNRRGKSGERITSLRDAFERARDAAEMPEGFVAHDLRHRRATRWIAEGGKIVHVKEALGHSSIQTTMRYTHLARTHLRDLVEDSSDGAPRKEGAG